MSLTLDDLTWDNFDICQVHVDSAREICVDVTSAHDSFQTRNLLRVMNEWFTGVIDPQSLNELGVQNSPMVV